MPARRIAMLLSTCALLAPAAAHAQSTGGTAAPEPDPALSATEHPHVGQVMEFRGTLPHDAGRTQARLRRGPPGGVRRRAGASALPRTWSRPRTNGSRAWEVREWSSAWALE